MARVIKPVMLVQLKSIKISTSKSKKFDIPARLKSFTLEL